MKAPQLFLGMVEEGQVHAPFTCELLTFTSPVRIQ
jgi:hypothetical protein